MHVQCTRPPPANPRDLHVFLLPHGVSEMFRLAVVIDPQVGGGTEEMWHVLRSQKKHFVVLKVPCQRWLFTAALSYTVKKTPWREIVLLFPARESLVSAIPAGNAKCCHLKKLTCKGILRRVIV